MLWKKLQQSVTFPEVSAASTDTGCSGAGLKIKYSVLVDGNSVCKGQSGYFTSVKSGCIYVDFVQLMRALG